MRIFVTDHLVRQFRAIFLLLLFITSFTRCWADSSGFLEGTIFACCEPAEHVHDDHEHESSDKDHDEGSETPEPDCSNCDLVKSGFTQSSLDLTIPFPLFVDLDKNWNDLLLRIERLSYLEEYRGADPPERVDVLVMSRIVTTSAVSVRGPNLV